MKLVLDILLIIMPSSFSKSTSVKSNLLQLVDNYMKETHTTFTWRKPIRHLHEGNPYDIYMKETHTTFTWRKPIRHLHEGNPYDFYVQLVTLPSNSKSFHLIPLITISTFDISCNLLSSFDGIGIFFSE